MPHLLRNISSYFIWFYIILFYEYLRSTRIVHVQIRIIIELIELTVINILDTLGSRLYTAAVRTSIRTSVVYKKTCIVYHRLQKKTAWKAWVQGYSCRSVEAINRAYNCGDTEVSKLF